MGGRLVFKYNIPDIISDKQLIAVEKRKPGRPKGSRNKPKTAEGGDAKKPRAPPKKARRKAQTESEEEEEQTPLTPGRGPSSVVSRKSHDAASASDEEENEVSSVSSSPGLKLRFTMRDVRRIFFHLFGGGPQRNNHVWWG